MSERATRWARELRYAPTGARLPGPVAHLTLLLATYHSDVGPSRWPKVAEIKEVLNISERSVQYHLDWMESNQLMQRDHRGGRGQASGYTLLIPAPERVQANADSEEKGCIPDCTLSNEEGEKGASQIAPFDSAEQEKGAKPAAKRVQTSGEKGANATNGGGTIGGSTRSTTRLGVPSPSVLSEPTETQRAAQRQKTPAVFDLEAVTAELTAKYADRWTADEVRERIAYAMQHKKGAATWGPDKSIGLRRWLGKDAKDEDIAAAAVRARAAPPAPHRNGTATVPAQRQTGRTQTEVAPDDPYAKYTR